MFVQRMKAIYPDGVVRLAGYSFGACVAIEMALQLQQQGSGDSVQSLVLLDGSHSSVAAYTDRTRQRVASSGDAPSTETGVICAFVSQFAFRLAHSEEVCYLYLRIRLNCIVTMLTTSEESNVLQHVDSFDSLHC